MAKTNREPTVVEIVCDLPPDLVVTEAELDILEAHLLDLITEMLNESE